MTGLLSLIGSLIASGIALFIATRGWQKSDRRALEDRDERIRLHQADLLAQLLGCHFAALAKNNMGAHDAEMKAVLLQLPGHLATTLRHRLKLQYTMKSVPLDLTSAARLHAHEKHDAGHKWLIFDRSSVLTKRTFEPRAEWIEAELAYDIAGLRGGDQDAVLAALKHDVRDPKDAAIAMLQERGETTQ